MDQKLSELVEELTTSGEPQLNPEKMKELKKICKSSDEHISHVYHLLITQLNQEHAEIRFSAFQIVNELFSRSHQFRMLIICNFQEFLELTVETDYEQPLPPPREVAQKLKKMAIKSVQEWHEKYGEAYKKLSLGYHFLKQNKKVDFHDVQSKTVADRKREEEKQKRLENIYKEKVKNAEKEMEEMSEEILASLTEMKNGFKLLMPDPFEFSVHDVEMESAEDVPKASASPQGSTRVDDEQPCCSKDLCTVIKCQSPVEINPSKNGEKLNETMEEDNESESEFGIANEESFIRDHGLGSHTYNINVDISTDLKIRETEDNTAVVSNLTDNFKLLRNKFWPTVQSWIQLFTKAGVNDERLKRNLDLKKVMETAMNKYEELNLESTQRERRVMKATDDEEEDDFVEVPEKEGYEPHIPDYLRKEYGLEQSTSSKEAKKALVAKKPVATKPPLVVKKALASKPVGAGLQPRTKKNEEELDPTCAAATWKVIRDKLTKLTSQPSSVAADPATESDKTNKDGKTLEEERAKAPVLPYGVDLYYWGEDQPTAGKLLKFASEHRFWAPSQEDEEVENKDLAAMSKTRYITFAGKFEPVKHKCLAPLPNGSLCPRQDRFKCPFHGTILPRDELGNPTNPEDKAKEEKMKLDKEAEEQDWRDPELMREIEAATGEDLGSSLCPGKGKGKGKKKGKKKKYPNLTDLKHNANTSRSRLEKKVFNKGSMQRIISAMNKVDARRHEKFSNQFNYALN
ncbi:UV-stimulated scaffold protein A isoform X2 [Ambystoma mexicanum]